MTPAASKIRPGGLRRRDAWLLPFMARKHQGATVPRIVHDRAGDTRFVLAEKPESKRGPRTPFDALAYVMNSGQVRFQRISPAHRIRLLVYPSQWIGTLAETSSCGL